MAKVLLFSYWPVFTREGMTCSVGLRAWGLARALSNRGHQVRIAEPASARPVSCPAPQDRRIEMVGWQHPKASRRLIEEADVVVVQPTWEMWPHFARARPRCLVVDLYAPLLLEGVSFLKSSKRELDHYAHMVSCHLYFLRRGDAFLCAGERQRRYCTGALAAAGRLNPLTSLHEILRVVPMGTEPEPPAAPPEPLLRGRRVAEDAELLLWPGGIYPWFDALTVVRALARVRRDRPRATLLFIGAENPQAGSLSSPGAAAALQEARRLGLPEEAVQFAPWLPYDRRAAMYLEADLAVTAHKPLLEAEFSWRTRTLDCLWGGLPQVVTEGDELAEQARAAGAALCVPPGDDTATAEAVAALLADPERRSTMRAAARQLSSEVLSWDRVVEPLHALCLDPRPAADHRHRVLTSYLDRTFAPRCPPTGWGFRALACVRRHGFRATVHRAFQEFRPVARPVQEGGR
jgi:glycosyltransferase involved in cell wall biosynthesis